MHIRRLLPLLMLSAFAIPAAAQEVAPPADAPAAAPVPVAVEVPVTGTWSRSNARDLLAFVERVEEEGLDPAAYDPADLREAIASESGSLSRIATDIFVRLSSDLMLGRTPKKQRVDWYLKDDDFIGLDQQAVLDRALSGNSVAASLRSLLPTHPQYAALKTVLASTTDSSLRPKILANLDRWRWLPRDLGQKYVIVNVPAYTVALVEGGNVTARRRAVAGALKTPTPALSAVISGAIFNPWWEVPASIAPEVRGKKGYVTVKNGNGVRYRQPPGPSNALGRMKLVMPNPHAIFLHDTNAKQLFNRHARALSHGCIRTEDAVGFAAVLLESTEWDREKIDQSLADGKTVQANLAAPVPVYITYFTVAGTSDGPGFVTYKDIYGRDGAVQAALSSSRTAYASAAE